MHNLYPSHTEVSKASFVQPGLFSLLNIQMLLCQSSLSYDHQPERCMREIRPYGSEGRGEVELSLPLSPIMDF